MHLAFIVLIEYIVFSKKRKDLFLIFQFYLERNICFTILNSFKMFSYFQLAFLFCDAFPVKWVDLSLITY